MVTPAAERKAMVHLCEEHQVNQRRPCDVLQVDRSTVRYQSVHVENAELREAIKRVSRERRRFGYRRSHAIVQRVGHMVNHKKLRRIPTEEKLQVRRRGAGRGLGQKKANGAARWSKPAVEPGFRV